VYERKPHKRGLAEAAITKVCGKTKFSDFAKIPVLLSSRNGR
jgi:hypothetical protein